ncbi:hypothetical protein BVY03_01350, partial [bacterium K02(2017)]
MLKELYIKNMAVIDELRLNFENGFQVLTGETGAGKTILVEAIGLILGGKVAKSLIRDGTDEAMVEASFDLQTSPNIKAWLKKEAFENDENKNELIIKRVLSTTNSNKIYLNHLRAKLSLLQKLAPLLVDFTGQHEQIK